MRYALSQVRESTGTFLVWASERRRVCLVRPNTPSSQPSVRKGDLETDERTMLDTCATLLPRMLHDKLEVGERKITAEGRRRSIGGMS